MGERPDRAIVHLGEKLGVGLVVVGSRGLSPLKRSVMGSVSTSVVRHVHCPVLVVRTDGSETAYLPRRILLALDGSEEARLAARTTVELAHRTDSELHVVHVAETRPISYPETHEYLAMYEKVQERAQQLLDERSEEHTSELQSRQYLVCRLLLEKKKKKVKLHTV